MPNCALLKMAIVDFFHCENLSDMAVESNHFCKIWMLQRLLVQGSLSQVEKKW